MVKVPKVGIGRRNLKDDKSILECPLDKVEHTMPNGKSVDQAFPINYSIIKGLEAYVKEKKFGAYYKRYCFKHRSESLNFYCETHKMLIC